MEKHDANGEPRSNDYFIAEPNFSWQASQAFRTSSFSSNGFMPIVGTRARELGLVMNKSYFTWEILQQMVKEGDLCRVGSRHYLPNSADTPNADTTTEIAPVICNAGSIF